MGYGLVDGWMLTRSASAHMLFSFICGSSSCLFLFGCSSAEAFRLVGQHLLAPLVVKGIDYVRLVYM